MTSDLEYDRERPLFLPPAGRFRIGEAERSLELALATGRPILIYIHGRAKDVGEPKKSVAEKIYQDLDSYGVTTLGFTWDADDAGYDESRPLASVEGFLQLLTALRQFIRARPDLPLPSLIAHSMGNVIVSELAKDGDLDGADGRLFKNIVLTAAAVKVKRHDRWLSRIKAAQNVYVLVNPHDVVLNFAGVLWRPDMLGQTLRPPLAPEPAFYLRLDRLGVNYRYFVQPGQNGKQSLKAFFSSVLSGNAPDLAAMADVEGVDGIATYLIRDR